MVVVNIFDERLHTALSFGLGGTHGTSNLSGTSLNTSNKGVRKASFLLNKKGVSVMINDLSLILF